eukprot:6723697-Lingulodinium_polyedra.AAC.1
MNRCFPLCSTLKFVGRGTLSGIADVLVGRPGTGVEAQGAGPVAAGAGPAAMAPALTSTAEAVPSEKAPLGPTTE